MTSRCSHDGFTCLVDAGFYDGYYAGVFECSRCASPFWMSMISYDTATRWRLFSGFAISQRETRALRDAIASFEAEAELQKDIERIIDSRPVSLIFLARQIETPSVVACAVLDTDQILVAYRDIEEATTLSMASSLRHLEARGVLVTIPQ